MPPTIELPARTHGDYELRQLVGQRRDKRTQKVVSVKTDMDQVFHCGERIGYIGRHAGAPFCPLRRNMGPDETQSVLDAIKAIRENEVFGPPGGAANFPNVTIEQIESVQRRQREQQEQEEEDEYDDED